MRKFYRNIVSVTVLTEDDPLPEEVSLAALEDAYTSGEHVAGPVSIVSEELSSKDTADQLAAFGSEPEFFGLDSDGDELETDDDLPEDAFEDDFDDFDEIPDDDPILPGMIDVTDETDAERVRRENSVD